MQALKRERGRVDAFGAFQRPPRKSTSTSTSTSTSSRKDQYSTSTSIYLIISTTMDGLQLRDEAVRDRIRAAQEFLDPRTPLPP
jgi:hypothetical protein